MELTIEYTATVGAGASPQAVHMMDNGLRVFYLDDGAVKAYEAYPPMGIYTDIEYADKGRVCTNRGVSKPQLKKVAHHGAYGFWSADVLSHRFVMYMLPTDISETVDSMTVSHSKDSTISQMSATLLNVHNRLVGRSRSIVQPNVRMELYFSMGDSTGISLGSFYIDRTSINYPEGKVSVSARNTIGKLLKEQTFDENVSFSEGDLKLNLEAVLALSQVEDCFVADPQKTWNLTFEPSTTLLEGLTQVVALLPGWELKETTAGVIGLAPSNDARFEQPGVFSFEREKTCWNYTTEYSDENTVSRVCVQCKEPEQTLYVTLEPHKWWNSPGNKTLYVTVPDGASSAELQSYADELADSVSAAGRIENFAGVFTPSMIVGDTVSLVEANGALTTLGVVTTVKHSLGRGGFYTEFTVDSSGRKGKARLKDYLTQITGGSGTGGVVIS